MGNIDIGNRWPRPLVLVIALLLMLLIVARAPSPAAVIAPSGVLSGVGRPVPLHDQPAASASNDKPAPPVSQIRQLRLDPSDGTYSQEQVTALAEPLDNALRYVSQRTGMQLVGPVNIRFEHSIPCSLNGITYPSQRLIVVWICPDTPTSRAINILAHELVHQLTYDHYRPAYAGIDLILSEGFATWGAGNYWLGGKENFRSFVQQHYAGQLLPLHSHYRDYSTTAAMNQLYYQWAALIEWIIATHGRDTFDDLYISSHDQQPGSADYQAILGTDLDAIERQWKEWLRP